MRAPKGFVGGGHGLSGPRRGPRGSGGGDRVRRCGRSYSVRYGVRAAGGRRASSPPSGPVGPSPRGRPRSPPRRRSARPAPPSRCRASALRSTPMAAPAPDLHDVEIPEQIPAVVLSSSVVFPYDVVSVQVSKPQGLRLLEQNPGDSVIVACLFPKDPETRAARAPVRRAARGRRLPRDPPDEDAQRHDPGRVPGPATDRGEGDRADRAVPHVPRGRGEGPRAAGPRGGRPHLPLHGDGGRADPRRGRLPERDGRHPADEHRGRAGASPTWWARTSTCRSR